MKASPYSAVAAIRWALAFVVGMAAVPPPHNTWAWLCLLPFCWHFWRTLGLIQALVRARAERGQSK